MEGGIESRHLHAQLENERALFPTDSRCRLRQGLDEVLNRFVLCYLCFLFWLLSRLQSCFGAF